MVRATGLTLVGALLLGAAFAPGRLSDHAAAHPFGKPLAIDEQPAIPVHVFEYGFEPSRLVILAGQVVVWRNIGEELHIVAPLTAAGAPVWRRAERLGTTRHVFTRAGTFAYHCSIHPQMRGEIVVRPRG